MSKRLDTLVEHGFFNELAPETLEFLAESSTERRVEAGDVLFRHGKRADRFYLLLDGEVSIEIPALVGPTLEVQLLGPGQVLGWSWLIAPYKWNFQARATRPSTLIEFDGEAILARCESDPAFGYALFKRFAGLMSERLDAARRKMMDEWNPPGFA